MFSILKIIKCLPMRVKNFEYPPIHMFLDTNGADTITNNRNVTITLNHAI